MAGFPSVEAYLAYQEVCGRVLTPSEVHDLVRPLSLEDCLLTIGKLSGSLEFEGKRSPIELDQMVASSLTDPTRSAALALITQGRRLLFDSRLSTLARVALRVADRRPADAFRDGADVPLFAEALLAVADTYDPDRIAPSGKVDEDEISKLMLRRLAATTTGALMPSLVRYWRLYVDLPRRHPDLYVGNEDFDRRMSETIGMSSLRYLALAFAIFVRFSIWSAQENSAWTITDDYWAKSTATANEFSELIGLLGSTPDDFDAAFSAQEKKGFNTIDDLRPFALHPLCEISEGAVIPIDVKKLGPRLFGDGLYWRLLPESDAAKSDYNASLGHFFERHCLEVARSVYPKLGAQRLFGEVSYKGDDGSMLGPDLVVADGGRTVFIETGVNRVNVRDTLYGGDLKSYERDIESIILYRVRQQLDRKITEARNGQLRFGNYTPDDLGTIFPVLCLIDGFPLAPSLRSRVEQAIQDAGLLQHEDIGRLSIISGEELEALLGEAEHAGTPMSSLLEEHADEPRTRDWTMRDHLVATRGGLSRPAYLKNEWERARDVLAQEIFGSLASPAI